MHLGAPAPVPCGDASALVPALSQRLSRLAFGGLLAWGALLFFDLAVEDGVAEEAAHLILLAPLALVPLYLDASLPASFGDAPRPLAAISWALGPAAVLAAISFLVPSGLWGRGLDGPVGVGDGSAGAVGTRGARGRAGGPAGSTRPRRSSRSGGRRCPAARSGCCCPAEASTRDMAISSPS